MAFLTDRALATGVTLTDLIHIVITGDTSQNPAGSSYKAQIGQITSLISPLSITGGTYNPTTGVVTFTNSSGGTFDVSGFTTGYTAVEVTGFTYNDSNTFSIFETDATILTASINVVTGMTFNGFLQTSGSSASGVYSFAFGDNTTSSGDYSFSNGRLAVASGNWSHAEGLQTFSIGSYSHAEGRGSSATTLYDHAEGQSTLASGGSSHSEGNRTRALGVGSHSEGSGTTASGQYSHSEGVATLASGDYSHAEGGWATGPFPIVIISGGTAIGLGSHAEGRETITYGNGSHSEGYGTISNGLYQHVQGQFNLTASTQSAFIIGNGTSNLSRSNLVLAASNTFNIYGDLNVSGTIFSTGSTQFISTTGITTSAITLSSGITYNGINYVGNVDLTLPTPVGVTGLKIIIKDEGGNSGSYRIRVTPAAGTIDGNSFVDMNINYMSLTFVARNNNWWII
jgi:hypothetical protein